MPKRKATILATPVEKKERKNCSGPGHCADEKKCYKCKLDMLKKEVFQIPGLVSLMATYLPWESICALATVNHLTYKATLSAKVKAVDDLAKLYNIFRGPHSANLYVLGYMGPRLDSAIHSRLLAIIVENSEMMKVVMALRGNEPGEFTAFTLPPKTRKNEILPLLRKNHEDGDVKVLNMENVDNVLAHALVKKRSVYYALFPPWLIDHGFVANQMAFDEWGDSPDFGAKKVVVSRPPEDSTLSTHMFLYYFKQQCSESAIGGFGPAHPMSDKLGLKRLLVDRKGFDLASAGFDSAVIQRSLHEKSLAMIDCSTEIQPCGVDLLDDYAGFFVSPQAAF